MSIKVVTPEAPWIEEPEGVVVGVGVEVDASGDASRIGLEEANRVTPRRGGAWTTENVVNAATDSPTLE